MLSRSQYTKTFFLCLLSGMYGVQGAKKKGRFFRKIFSSSKKSHDKKEKPESTHEKEISFYIGGVNINNITKEKMDQILNEDITMVPLPENQEDVSVWLEKPEKNIEVAHMGHNRGKTAAPSIATLRIGSHTKSITYQLKGNTLEAMEDSEDPSKATHSRDQMTVIHLDHGTMVEILEDENITDESSVAKPPKGKKRKKHAYVFYRPSAIGKKDEQDDHANDENDLGNQGDYLLYKIATVIVLAGLVYMIKHKNSPKILKKNTQEKEKETKPL